MSCFLDTDGGDRVAVLLFGRDMLMYDIKNYAYIEGSIMPKTTEAHNRHFVQDIGEAGNEDRVSRVLDLSHAQVKETLYPYTKHEIRNSTLDNKLRKPKVYGIVLKVPGDFSQTTLELLERQIHEYMVCKVMEDWLSITHPDKSRIWGEKAASALEESRNSISSRLSRVRRRLHPF